MQQFLNEVNLSFHKHYCSRVEVEFSKMTNSKCLEKLKKTYLKFFHLTENRFVLILAELHVRLQTSLVST